MEKGEEIDRALLWKYARKDKNGQIVDEEVALMAEKIVSTNSLVNVWYLLLTIKITEKCL